MLKKKPQWKRIYIISDKREPYYTFGIVTMIVSLFLPFVILVSFLYQDYYFEIGVLCIFFLFIGYWLAKTNFKRIYKGDDLNTFNQQSQ